MPDEFTPKFENESAVLEEDMQRLAAEVQKHRETPEGKTWSDDELLRRALDSIAAVEEPSSSPVVQAPQVTQQPAKPQVTSILTHILPQYVQDAPAESKLEVEYLLDILAKHGLRKALATAKKSSPFVLDAFRDALILNLHAPLKERGSL